MIQLPPIRVTQGEPLLEQIQWQKDGIPVDLSDWNGEFSIRRVPGGKVTSYPVATGAGGKIDIDVPDTSDFPTLRGFGERVSGIYQLRLTAPDGEVLTMQGALIVARDVK